LGNQNNVIYHSTPLATKTMIDLTLMEKFDNLDNYSY